jgi:hypothetical protein
VWCETNGGGVGPVAAGTFSLEYAGANIAVTLDLMDKGLQGSVPESGTFTGRACN